jgi:threonine aldolase
VLRAIAEAGSGDAPPYGADPLTRAVSKRLSALFGADGGAFFVFTGTAANILGLSLMLRRYEAVICADGAHINTDECGAVERILGCKLLPVPAPDGKLTPDLVAGRLTGRHDEHRAQPRVVAITQATEAGTCYTLAELRELREYCKASDLLLYIDGARLANAAAFLGCPLAEIASTADVLSFGATKNGAVAAEAMIVMNAALAADVPFLRKQQMQLASKMRFVAAQFGALLDGELWLANARNANRMASLLADGVAAVPGVRLVQPVQSNAVFAALEPRVIEALQREWAFHVWDEPRHVVRWMTAFDTTEQDVDEFVAGVQAVSGAPARDKAPPAVPRVTLR